jgi:hypothetical protein
MWRTMTTSHTLQAAENPLGGHLGVDKPAQLFPFHCIDKRIYCSVYTYPWLGDTMLFIAQSNPGRSRNCRVSGVEALPASKRTMKTRKSLWKLFGFVFFATRSGSGNYDNAENSHVSSGLAHRLGKVERASTAIWSHALRMDTRPVQCE